MMRRRQSGFTLPELLVALLVFSLVATAAVYCLRLGVEARDQFAAAEARLAETQIARIAVKDDLAQLVERPVRDEFGESLGPSFRGGAEIRPRHPQEGETTLLAFVRGGWTNPLSDAPRSTLQYVEYVVKDGALLRRFRPYLDDARGQPRYERILLRDVRGVKIGFLAGEARGELDFAPGWPVPGAASGVPKAIYISFENDRFGEMRQLFWIGAFGARTGREQ